MNLAITNQLALSVALAFAILSPGTVVAAGWRERGKQINQGSGGANRVVFIPGDVKTGRAGNFAPVARKSTTNPAALAQLDELHTMSVWAYDGVNSNDEMAQVEAVEALLELAIQAVHFAVSADTGQALGGANVKWIDKTWTISSVEITYGREVLVTFTIATSYKAQTVPTCTPGTAIISRNPAS